MSRQRTVTDLKLFRATVGGQRGWVEAEWARADKSKGSATAWFRAQTATRWYIATLRVSVPTSALLRDIPLARIEAAANADPAIRKWIEDAAEPETVKRMKRDATSRIRLQRPKQHYLDDAFYRKVAEAYKAAAAAGLPPAKTLAEDSESPQGTVNRWIAKARAKHFLPKGEPGKVRA